MNNENRKQIRRLENKIYSAQKESLGIKDINDLRRIRNEILSLQHNIDRLLDIPSEAVNYMPARPAPSAPSAPMSKTMKVLCFFSISWFISAKL